MASVFLDIAGLLEKGKAAAYARIIRQEGSSPRAAGTGCVILEDGAFRGTIGGGRLEHDVVAQAKENFSAGRSFLLHFGVTGTEWEKTEEISCGGRVDVFTEYFSPADEAARSLFHLISETILAGKKGVLLTLVSEQTKAHVFLTPEGNDKGSIQGLVPAEEERASWFSLKNAALLEKAGVGEIFFEPVAPEDVLYVFGAGHISACLVPLAKMLGFRVTVIDDRADFCHAKRFPTADELIVAPFAGVYDQVFITASTYIVVVTSGHIHDQMLLREALRRAPAYIGMIGSSRKIKAIYQALLKEGFSQERLQEVYAPIGIKIGAETPEEIAVCIAAQLIQVRADLRKTL